MDKVYLLQHSYEVSYQGETFDRTKIIGIYSSKEKAEEVIQIYKTIQGFSKYSLACFFVDEYILDENNWTEGFVGTDEIAHDFEILTECFNKWLGISGEVANSWEDDNYYNALCEVNEKVYKAKNAQELANHIYLVWSVRFRDAPKTIDDCLVVATEVINSLKLR